MVFQNRRFGIVLPRSQFLSVPKLTPSRLASPVLVILLRKQWAASISCSLFKGGCESTLVAFITRWQNGFKRDPFRQFDFCELSLPVDLHLVPIASDYIIAA
jgi:hypothetical protein